MGDDPPQAGPPSIACRGCEYDLTGLPDQFCPECGRAFDPADPATYWDLASRRNARARRRKRIAAITLAVASITALVVYGIVPRPASSPTGGIQWGFWVWLGRGYGVQRVDMMAESFRLHRWGSRVDRIESRDQWSASAPRPLWSLERIGQDRWHLDVVDPSVEWRSLLLGFNTMRRDEELFGVAIIGSDRDACEEPFTVSGTRVDVLAAMIRVYGLQTRPGQTSPDDLDVWVISPDTGDLVEVPIPQAIEMGIAVTPYQGDVVARIEVAQ